MPLNLSTQGVNGCWCCINTPPPTHHTHSRIPYRNSCKRMRFISVILVPAVPLKVHICAQVTWQVQFEAALHCDLIHFSFFLSHFSFASCHTPLPSSFSHLSFMLMCSEVFWHPVLLRRDYGLVCIFDKSADDRQLHWNMKLVPMIHKQASLQGVHTHTAVHFNHITADVVNSTLAVMLVPVFLLIVHKYCIYIWWRVCRIFWSSPPRLSAGL